MSEFNQSQIVKTLSEAFIIRNELHDEAPEGWISIQMLENRQSILELPKYKGQIRKDYAACNLCDIDLDIDHRYLSILFAQYTGIEEFIMDANVLCILIRMNAIEPFKKILSTTHMGTFHIDHINIMILHTGIPEFSNAWIEYLLHDLLYSSTIHNYIHDKCYKDFKPRRAEYRVEDAIAAISIMADGEFLDISNMAVYDHFSMLCGENLQFIYTISEVHIQYGMYWRDDSLN